MENCTNYHLYCSGYDTSGNSHNIYGRVTICIVVGLIHIIIRTIFYALNWDKHLKSKSATYLLLFGYNDL